MKTKKLIINLKDIFLKNFKKCVLNQENLIDKDPLVSIKIFGDLLSKGWAKEAIPILTKKVLGFQGYSLAFFE